VSACDRDCWVPVRVGREGGDSCTGAKAETLIPVRVKEVAWG